MIQTFAQALSNWHRPLMILLGLSTVAGWGSLVTAGRSAAESERQLQEQVATLQNGQKQLLVEPDRSQIAAIELAQLRQQLGSAQDEIARLTQDRSQAQLKIPAARPPLNASSSTARPARNGVSQTSSVGSLPPTPPQAPARLVQAGLTKPTNGIVVAQASDSKGQAAQQVQALKPAR
jgi:hypothetical protein